MTRANLLTIVIAGAFWPVWFWYFERFADKSDEPLGLLALLTFCGLQFLHKDITPLRKPPFILIVAASLIYILTACFAPKAVQAVAALLVASLFLNMTGVLKKLSCADYALLFLSLPVVSTLNFYFGYPLRLLVTQSANILLHLAGLAVTAQGTALSLSGQTVEIDAPCSGLKTLWFSLYMTATLGSSYRLPLPRFVLLSMVALLAAIVANVMRVSSLFYVETGLLTNTIFADQEKFVHESVGVASFIFVGIILILYAKYLSNPEQAQSKPENLENKKAELTSWLFWQSFIVLSIIAVVPFFNCAVKTEQSHFVFPGWPKEFEGQALVPNQLGPEQELFLEGFPGQAAIFSCGRRQVLMRWIEHESRQVHSSSDCLRGLGYEVNYLPLVVDQKGTRWNHFSARQGTDILDVHERIYDERGNSWNDVSAWYWAAALGKTKPPFWSVTTIEKKAAN